MLSPRSPSARMTSSLARVALVTGLILLVPVVAMQVTAEVAWGPGDFLAAGALLFGAGVAMVASVRWFRRTASRVAAVALIATAVALVWAELAVGLFR
ncbi:MAG: hypothetical protein BroJett026_16080 [Betaproteobacteria bacterium]|nr:MAG: hypothetical protein BroJett026_16080 [Betaproteobacteria bacterium]